MKLKLIVSSISAVALVASLFSGCSSDDVTKITMFNMKNEQATAFQKIIDEYHKLHPSVRISLETYGGSQDYHAPLKAKMQSDPPAIFPVTGVQDLNDYKDVVADLSNEQWVGSCSPSATEDVTVDGKVYGLPAAVEGYGYAVNAKIFEAAGIDVKSMYAFDGMKAGFTKLKEKIDAGELKSQFPNLKAVFAMPDKELWVLGDHILNAVLNKDFTTAKQTYEAKTIPFAGADVYKDIIDFQVSFTEYPDNPSMLTAVDYTTALNKGFMQENYAVIQQGNWIESVIKEQNPSMVDDLDMIPYNLPDGSTDGKFLDGSPCYWVVNKGLADEQISASKNFLSWMYTSNVGQELLKNDAALILPFNNVDHSNLSTFSKRVYDSFKSGDVIPNSLSNATPTGWSKNIAGAAVQKYLSEGNWDSLVEEMQLQWQALRAK